MGAILVIILCVLAAVLVYAFKTSEHEQEQQSYAQISSDAQNNNGTLQTTEDAPNDGSTPTPSQPVAQGAPLTREELDRLLFKYHDKLFGTIVKAILMAMFIWSAIGGVVAGLIVAASVH